MLFAIVPIGQGNMASQLGSMLAGPSVVPEAQMLGSGPEMYNCMECKYPLLSFPSVHACWHNSVVLRKSSLRRFLLLNVKVDCTVGNHYFSGATAARQGNHYMHVLSFSLEESILDPPFSLFLPRILLRFTPFFRQSQSDWPHRRLHLPTGQVPLHWYVRVFVNVYI
jgi:hypothetical protein